MKISSTSTLVMTASLLASNVAASSLLERTSSAFDILIARQSTSSGIDPSEIPTQCETQCTTVLNTISACTTDSCICTTTNADEMESCVNCLVSIDPTADMIEEGNEILLSLEVECDTVSGFPSLSVSASTTISDDTSSVTALEGSSVSSKSTVTQKSTATGTSTTTSSADSESTSDSGIKGLNGAVSYKGSMATVVFGALGCIVGSMSGSSWSSSSGYKILWPLLAAQFFSTTCPNHFVHIQTCWANMQTMGVVRSKFKVMIRSEFPASCGRNPKVSPSTARFYADFSRYLAS
ncbi:uncharacterized protein C8R40DRAFT_1074666 [Lentinula edodes]|uniref:uncharacterized protein n=1 Tax=Lentinula edodes TaxID=5353 RepID=UPI001E8ED1BD|nr:uncharacterized protein C8R40DRAFT_1074666 [Lentinula edodes]KAH7868616.1 hypothetical protein C8R40DRAFT_1074666 [Lentinula edodes]